MPLRIVHVSDIHFHKDTYGWDANRDQRQELISDLKDIVLSEGPVDAILVGGDIAFSAEPEEYDTARRWLSDLVAVCGGIDDSAVWTVPGNHDVSWAVLNDCHIAQDFRGHLRECAATAVDEILRVRMSADPAASGLFIPFKAYNDFAEQYICRSTPTQPHWFDDTTLEVDGWTVRLTGLNSALTSDWDDHNFQQRASAASPHAHDKREPSDLPALVLGTEQCRIPRAEHTIHVVMAHHPPEWIRDWDIVEPYMRRGHLWLFGHEHEYSAKQTVAYGSVQLSAGAVGPELDEGGETEPFVPAYSVITLSRTDDEMLAIRVQPRYWSLRQTRFVEHPSGEQNYEVMRVPALPEQDHDTTDTSQGAPGGQATDESTASSASSASPLAADNDSGHEGPPTVARPDLRRIATQYMSRPATRRVAIGLELGVIEDSDLGSDHEGDLYALILERVRERGLIEELAAKTAGA
ncbi:metallophosphoesterase family protein [Nocardioides litoris]|uniref:metallophosphoesterase family protein n=1 Tax=Nocardioides litoris TaxID=1926648 RepID=UPI0014773426|nr:metallophosphoesterase [Nocardioides litoris]